MIRNNWEIWRSGWKHYRNGCTRWRQPNMTEKRENSTRKSLTNPSTKHYCARITANFPPARVYYKRRVSSLRAASVQGKSLSSKSFYRIRDSSAVCRQRIFDSFTRSNCKIVRDEENRRKHREAPWEGTILWEKSD